MGELRPVGPASNQVLGELTPYALILGRHISADDNMIGGRMVYSGERHWIIYGPNGSGKSLRLLVPNLLQCPYRSFFVIDVKGQLAAMTAAYRASLGPVYVINPFGLWASDPRYPDLRSCGYNPLAKLDPRNSNFNAEAALLAEALIEVNERDPHWGDAARNLVTMLIMFTVLEAHGLLPDRTKQWAIDAQIPQPKPGAAPTMARVRQLLCLPSEEPHAKNNHRGSGIVAIALAALASGNEGLVNLAGQFTEWNKEISSVASTARTQTSPFDDAAMAADLAKDGPDFRTLKKHPASVFLVLPPKQLDRHRKWLRLLVSQAIYALMDEPEAGQPPTLFVLEEMAALGHLSVIETVYALVRDYKIQFASVWQDMPQLKRIYSAGWQTMIANAGIVTTFATNDGETCEWFSERSGEVGKQTVSYNQSKSTTNAPPHGPQSFLYGTKSTTESSSSTISDTKTRLAHRHSLIGMKSGATVNCFAGEQNIALGFAPMWNKIDSCKKRGRANPYYQGQASAGRDTETPAAVEAG